MNIENSTQILPKSCIGKFKESELHYCWETIKMRINEKQTIKTFHHKEEIEECIVHDFNYNKLKKNLSSLSPFKFQPYTLYRIIANPDFNYMITVFYSDITSISHYNPQLPPINENIEDVLSGSSSIHFDCIQNNNNTIIRIKSINSAKNTVINNMVETFQRHNIFPEYTELWYIKCHDKKVKSLYIIDCIFGQKLSDSVINSLESDFERYLHHYIKPLSIFDIVGPSMVGPSSSHTAGANKIGQIARNIIIAKIQDEKINVVSIEVTLLGSFRDTGPGHKTPAAIGGGLCGLPPDNYEMLKHGDPVFLKTNGINLIHCTAVFLGYKKGNESDDNRYKRENNNNIAEIIVNTEKDSYTITGFSIGGGNVEVLYINERLSEPFTGKEEKFIHKGQIISASESVKYPEAVKILPIENINSSHKSKFFVPFNTFEELLIYIRTSKKSLIDVIFEVEMNMQGTLRDEVLSKTESYWKIMKNSIRQGIKSNELSTLKLTGQDARKINKYVKKKKIFDNLYGRATAYAVAVNEVNAKSGVIVACPTAGSCGILPGILHAYSQLEKPSKQKLLESILVSGFLGMILFNDVTTAGASYGCQAEIGVGAAMAAAALTYIENGTPEQIVNGFTLAIKNSLGLICDPVAGLVEIPCVKRNGVFASLAISASMMALSGVRSFISPDEVIITMKEVGDKLHSDFKETAGGGLAKTRDGKAVDRAFESEVRRFFGNN